MSISHYINGSATGEWLSEMRKIEAEGDALDLHLERLERLRDLRRTKARLQAAVTDSEAETIRLQRELADTITELGILTAQVPA